MPPYNRSIKFAGAALVALVGVMANSLANASLVPMDEVVAIGNLSKAGGDYCVPTTQTARHLGTLGQRGLGEHDLLAGLTVSDMDMTVDDGANSRYPLDISQAGDRHDGGSALDVWRIRASDFGFWGLTGYGPGDLISYLAGGHFDQHHGVGNVTEPVGNDRPGQVPEPASLALVALALATAYGGLVMNNRRRVVRST